MEKYVVNHLRWNNLIVNKDNHFAKNDKFLIFQSMLGLNSSNRWQMTMLSNLYNILLIFGENFKFV